jgi:2-polyprenyl-6-methoxyphenol hydroxylase-like FAD-dependent oxidoreductase
METKKGDRAIVLGGGISGLSAASVLARHFEQVVVLERDTYDGAAVRLHTPHGAHAHLLLAGGLESFSALFPQIPAWLDEMGRVEGDLTMHTRVAFEGRWLPKAKSNIPIRPCSRSEVEQLLHRVASGLPRVQIKEGAKVEQLLGERRIEGVRFSINGASEELRASLIVDAMGRSSVS